MYYLRFFFSQKRKIHSLLTAGALRGVSTDVPKENKVFKQLKAKIEATGPITVADYMKETLISPISGYYMKKDVFGSSGDFITSPEISQIFGELIGIWFCNEWLKAGRPQPLQFIEFGPGRGTLADDVLRVFFKVLSAQKISLSVHLIDVSPHMRELQMSNLGIKHIENLDSSGDLKLQMSNLGIKNIENLDSSGDLMKENDCKYTFMSKHGYPVMFHQCLDTVPEGFSFFLAHEFFDALPIHKFQKTEEGWKEILINYKDGELQYVLSRNATPAAKYLIDPNEKRDHLEVCPEAGVLIQKLCKRMKEDGGITLIIDYGHDGTKLDTFRSFKQHKLHDPLKDPGEADLTADVDFSFLKKCINGEGYVAGPVTQAHFLRNMGIEIRLEKLMEKATPEIQTSLKSGYDMLTKEDQMGERFKFLAIYPKVLEKLLLKYPPAGF